MMSIETMSIHRVDVQRSSLERSDYGTGKEVWKNCIQRMPCRISPMSAYERMVAAQANLQVSETMVFKVDNNVLERDRIVFGSRILEVVSVRIIDGSTAFKRAELREYRAT